MTVQSSIHTWIDTQLNTQNITLTGDTECIHQRPWSTVYRIPTQQSDYFAKHTSSFARFEPALADFLQSIYPLAAPTVIATDTKNGYLLMPDAGIRLRETLIASPDWSHWEVLLPQYAQLQIASAPHLETLCDTHIPDRRLTTFADQFAHLVEQQNNFSHLSNEEYQQLRDSIPLVRQKVTALASFPIPQSIHHGDLHDGNIFYEVQQGKPIQYTFYDWGDASLSHPFFSLRTAYVSAEIRFGLAENDPQLHRLRNAYLPAWSAYANQEDIQTAFALASELWSISSMFSWHITIHHMRPSDKKAHDHILSALARELLMALSN